MALGRHEQQMDDGEQACAAAASACIASTHPLASPFDKPEGIYTLLSIWVAWYCLLQKGAFNYNDG